MAAWGSASARRAGRGGFGTTGREAAVPATDSACGSTFFAISARPRARFWIGSRVPLASLLTASPGRSPARLIVFSARARRSSICRRMPGTDQSSLSTRESARSSSRSFSLPAESALPIRLRASFSRVVILSCRFIVLPPFVTRDGV